MPHEFQTFGLIWETETKNEDKTWIRIPYEDKAL